MPKSDDSLISLHQENLSILQENIENLRSHGVSPDKLHFRFECQKCGLRCCFETHANSISFSPLSFAYMRKSIPEVILTSFFETKLLKWVVSKKTGPSLQLGRNSCPLLIFHWDHSARELYLQKLGNLENQTSPALEFLLIHILRKIDETIPIPSPKSSNISGIPIRQFIPYFLEAWSCVTHNHPFLYSNNPENFLIQFFDFLRLPSNNNLYFETSCSIWAYRPQTCRVYPLGRYLPLNGENQGAERVELQTDICPTQAFQIGPKRTASEYLREQNATSLEYSIITNISSFIEQHTTIINSFSAEEENFFYDGLLHTIFYSLESIPDESQFYQQLILHLDSFFEEILLNHSNFKSDT